jgi:hypothetical protein
MICCNQNLIKFTIVFFFSFLIPSSLISESFPNENLDLVKNITSTDTKNGATVELSESNGDSPKIQVVVGMYLVNLYDINTASGSFDADFWLWFNHKPDKNLDLLKSREFLNGENIQSVNSDFEEKSGVSWAIEKIKGKFIQDYDIAKFPYDRHELRIVIEESLKESSELIYVADSESSKIDDAAKSINGWRVKDLKLEVEEHKYGSNFGDPSKKEGASYSRLVAKIIIEREAGGLLMKVLFGLYIAIAIALISFLMKTDSEDIFSSRVSLLVGMIFAIILNKQAAEAAVGESSTPTIIGKLHNVGFAYIFIMIFLTLYSRHVSESSPESGGERNSIAFDRVAIVLLLSSFIGINYILICE